MTLFAVAEAQYYNLLCEQWFSLVDDNRNRLSLTTGWLMTTRLSSTVKCGWIRAGLRLLLRSPVLIICLGVYATVATAAVTPVITTELRSHSAPDNVGTGQISSSPFTTIPNLRTNDYVDLAAGHGVSVTVLNGALESGSGAASRLINGFWPTTSDDPANNVFFQNSNSGMFLFNLNGLVDTTEVNTYSRHTLDRTPQRYTLYGSDSLLAPSATGNLAANGWQPIADVNMRSQFESFNGIAGANIRNSVGSLGAYRFLLFDIHGVGSDGALGTFYSEIDVIGTLVPEPNSFVGMFILLLWHFGFRNRKHC